MEEDRRVSLLIEFGKLSLVGGTAVAAVLLLTTTASLAILFACKTQQILKSSCDCVMLEFSFVAGVFAIIAVAWFTESASPANTLMRRDKAVVVTGCDSGFGLRLALDLCEQGVQVFAACLSLDSDGAKHLLSLQSPLICLVKCDVTSDDDVTMLQQCVEQTTLPSRCE